MGKIVEIRKILGGVRPKKRFGQTFMIDPNLLASMVRDAGVTRKDIVLEIGTGIGALTEIIATVASGVVTVEIDENLALIAGGELAAFDNVEIVVTDFLGLSDTVAPEVERVMLAREQAPIVVSNLPYSTAGPIIAALILWKVPVRQAVLTVQKEMAERLVARPGSKDYGRLSVLVQKATGVEILRTIPAECFWPRPAVESAIVRLGQRKIDVEHAKMIEMLAGGVFQHRRKTVRNALIEATNLDMDGECADAFLRETGVDPLLRADQITPDQFGEMADFLIASAGSSGMFALKRLARSGSNPRSSQSAT